MHYYYSYYTYSGNFLATEIFGDLEIEWNFEDFLII